MIDLTVSGATTANILDEQQLSRAGVLYPPQVSALPAEADLVAITAGGNDLRFIGSMLFAAWSKAEPDGVITRVLAQEFGGGIPEATESEVGAVAEGLAGIVAAVRERASQALIILAGYLTVNTEHTPTGHGALFTSAERSAFLHLQHSLGEAYCIASATSGTELLAVSAASSDHGIGSFRPWVFGFRANPDDTMASFHPNRIGVEAVSHELFRVLATDGQRRS